MKIKFENVNFNSRSGPNSFSKKLYKYLFESGNEVVDQNYDAALCFIEDKSNLPKHNLFQRLDGIYFNTDFNFEQQNENILKTYKRAKGVIFQSEFNKELIFKYFGEHQNTTVIHNGADISLIKFIEPIKNDVLDKYENIWSCAASWRPHKRLKENIEYFLEHKGSSDCLVVAGSPNFHIKDPNIFFVGDISYEKLLSLYARSKYFIHLSWLDHCPNVVVDARASDCQIICSSTGGTQEVAGLDAVVIEEPKWDFEPTRLYKPPPMNFKSRLKNHYDSCYDMKKVAQKYINFMKGN